MSRAISRESFDELKNYLGVYLQQGRPILDADWNENQDISVSLIRRLTRESIGDGSPNRGFAIDPVFPPPPELMLKQTGIASPPAGLDPFEAITFIVQQLVSVCLVNLLDMMLNLVLYVVFGPLSFFISFPGQKLEDFESVTGFALSSTQGQLRIGKDRPYEGTAFLRLSGHAGNITVTKTLVNLIDLSSFELATFRFRMNHQTPGIMKFFLEDDDGNRTVWPNNNPAIAADTWLVGFAGPFDVSFRILPSELQGAVVNESYEQELFTFSGTTPMTWTVIGGTMPSGIALVTNTGDASNTATLGGTTSAVGSFLFTIQVKDAQNAIAKQQFSLQVNATGSGSVPFPLGSAAALLSSLGMGQFETPTGVPANLKQIRKYGFELYQDSNNPLVWDLDDLRLGSSALETEAGNNNFIIRGSEFGQFMNQVTMLGLLMNLSDEEAEPEEDEDNALQNLLSLMNTNFSLAEQTIEVAGRYYVGGLPCVQVHDTLYRDQADPNDPLLVPPTTGIREDTVYLDAWLEPVSYVEDPLIREVALGGPDTTTRLQLRHRVRVNQGGGLPTGIGFGQGTLATEGLYTAQANRLYLVEIDTAGNIGAATFRWSDDNGSTIQRVIEPIPPGSTRVVVEDASAFHAGDFILIRKEFGEEEHQISSVFANVITLQQRTGPQLAALPAASTTDNFTTFSMADRPKVQRWNAFKIPIKRDPGDVTISAAIDLNDGVQVRFGGKAMIKGDYWNFTTRYLAGDEESGINPVTRIEQLSFRLARGVRHYYAELAILTRDGDSREPDRIEAIRDRRQRTGNASTANQALPDIIGLTGTDMVHAGGLVLMPAALDTKHVVFWSGEFFLPAAAPIDSHLIVRVGFFDDNVTDLEADPNSGSIQDRELKVPLHRKPVLSEVPLQLIFSSSDIGLSFLPDAVIPTSVQVFIGLDQEDFTVELVNMQLTVLQLKKSH
jgi:hypothetical protein